MKHNKKQQAEVSKSNPVPLYRAYGVTKKEYSTIEWLKMWCERIIAATFLFIPITALIIGLLAVVLYSSTVIKVIVYSALFFFAASTITKKMRIRLTLNKKLKKLCKTEGYDLYCERKLFESLKWSENKCDLIVETESRLYYVHTLYTTKARNKLLFESANTIKLITPPPKSRLFVVLGIIFNFKTKTKTLSLDLSEDRSIGQKEAVSVILVLPNCQNMSYRVSSVSTIPTGNGGEHFGYTIFTPKGFINFLPRHEDNLRQKKSPQ